MGTSLLLEIKDCMCGSPDPKQVQGQYFNGIHSLQSLFCQRSWVEALELTPLSILTLEHLTLSNYLCKVLEVPVVCNPTWLPHLLQVDFLAT